MAMPALNPVESVTDGFCAKTAIAVDDAEAAAEVALLVVDDAAAIVGCRLIDELLAVIDVLLDTDEVVAVLVPVPPQEPKSDWQPAPQ